MSIGSNIRSLREERGLTQEQVADKIGITFQAVSSWERDEYKPDIDKIMKLAELFDVSISALVEERQGVFKTKDAIYNWEHMYSGFHGNIRIWTCLSISFKMVHMNLKAPYFGYIRIDYFVHFNAMSY